MIATFSAQAQITIELPYAQTQSIDWKPSERAYFSSDWETPVITNVSRPTLQMYRPAPDESNGAAVIVAPGGGFYALSIESEGEKVARSLTEHGYTAYVLKYRLVPSGEDGVKEIPADGDEFAGAVAPIVPLAIADGLAALSHVREQAERYRIDPARIGVMGFSAGGTVAVGATVNASALERPDFVVPVYPAVRLLGAVQPPENAPPMLVVCAADDGLDLAPDSVGLFSVWREAGASAGLHMYARGDHGFGMRVNGLPSDRWIERFYEWADAEGFSSASKE
jgi:acetyl esterase/lipase